MIFRLGKIYENKILCCIEQHRSSSVYAILVLCVYDAFFIPHLKSRRPIPIFIFVGVLVFFSRAVYK